MRGIFNIQHISRVLNSNKYLNIPNIINIPKMHPGRSTLGVKWNSVRSYSSCMSWKNNLEPKYNQPFKFNIYSGMNDLT